MQDIVAGVATLAQANVDWSPTAGPIWLLGCAILGAVAVAVTSWAAQPRVVDARVRNNH